MVGLLVVVTSVAAMKRGVFGGLCTCLYGRCDRTSASFTWSKCVVLHPCDHCDDPSMRVTPSDPTKHTLLHPSLSQEWSPRTAPSSTIKSHSNTRTHHPHHPHHRDGGQSSTHADKHTSIMPRKTSPAPTQRWCAGRPEGNTPCPVTTAGRT